MALVMFRFENSFCMIWRKIYKFWNEKARENEISFGISLNKAYFKSDRICRGPSAVNNEFSYKHNDSNQYDKCMIENRTKETEVEMYEKRKKKNCT